MLFILFTKVVSETVRVAMYYTFQNGNICSVNFNFFFLQIGHFVDVARMIYLSFRVVFPETMFRCISVLDEN